MIPVDVSTWQGTEPISGVKSIKVVNKANDEVPKIQSGSISVVIPEGERFPTGWYRIEMVGYDGSGSATRLELATLLFEQSSGKNDYGVETVSVSGQSVLKPVEDLHMRNGSYIEKYSNGAEWCLNMLMDSTPAPVVLDDPKGFVVDRYFVFDASTSVLKAVWKILDSAGWVLQIDGDGTIHILDKPKGFEVEFGRENLRYIKPGISYDEDVSDIPNVYKARLGGQYVEVVNDDPDSITSTVSRNYVKDVMETDPVPIDGETLQHYAERMLEESSTVYKTYDYDRDGFFDIKVFDNVFWNIPNVHTGLMRVLEQTITCEQGISFQERCGEELKLWERS